MVGPRTTRVLEGGLHPQTGGASQEEKVQLIGQALTHQQKEHLAEFTGKSPEAMYEHLVGFHGFTPSPPTLREISGFKNGIPRYEEVPNLTSKIGYVSEHLTLHHADLAERKTSRQKVEHVTTGPHVLSGVAGFYKHSVLGIGTREKPAPFIRSQSDAEAYVHMNPHKVVVFNMKTGKYSTRDRELTD